VVTFLRAVSSGSRNMVGIIYRYRRMLTAITRIELAKRHAGSVLGMTWVVLQPALLLSVYVFVYMVVLRMRFEGFSRFDYVLYVFCGLVPYLRFMEALTTALSIKQNIHLVKNVMLPIELIGSRGHRRDGEPICEHRSGSGAADCGSLSWNVAWLPLNRPAGDVARRADVILSSITVALPDIVFREPVCVHACSCRRSATSRVVPQGSVGSSTSTRSIT
jgi:hypothetical protein